MSVMTRNWIIAGNIARGFRCGGCGDSRCKDDGCTQLRTEISSTLDAKDRERESQLFTIISTIGGKVEGHPTSSINYLQRLRELVDIETRHNALTEGQ